MKAYQENVNKKVLIDWVRLTGLPNPRRRKLDVLLNDFAQDIVKYPSSRGTAFTWPSPAGFYGNHMAIRARMSYDFWKHFLSEGRKALYEYNKFHGTEIKLSREKTLPITEQERLGLFIRKKFEMRIIAKV
ncbi:unnamed protein product [Cylicocyclus nassatus]|uniref:Uncharacterized protein n=1 Tax=Cylicocyclus nassatus TaxID=53992 RepID=A0AA36GK91_CYLNA|nr:unnamed protein product [Cylicocyclus nassatus]